jgi:hypothetical protein
MLIAAEAYMQCCRSGIFIPAAEAYMQCCRSGIFIPDPDFYPSRIPDPKTATKKRAVKSHKVFKNMG